MKYKPAVQPELFYEGTFVVVNATGSQINTVFVSHTCASMQDVVNVPLLDPGQTAMAPLRAITGAEDHWELKFFIGNQEFSREDKDCGYVSWMRRRVSSSFLPSGLLDHHAGLIFL